MPYSVCVPVTCEEQSLRLREIVNEPSGDSYYDRVRVVVYVVSCGQVVLNA